MTRHVRNNARVYHLIFGAGTVTDVGDKRGQLAYTVAFDDGRVHRIAAGYLSTKPFAPLPELTAQQTVVRASKQRLREVEWRLGR